MFRPVFWASIGLVLSSSTLVHAQFPPSVHRTWKDVSGSPIIRAQLVELTDGVARLRKDDGGIIDVPMEQLFPEDRQFIEAYVDLASRYKGGLLLTPRSGEAAGDAATSGARTGAPAPPGVMSEALPGMENELSELTPEVKKLFSTLDRALKELGVKLAQMPQDQRPEAFNREDPRSDFADRFYQLAETRRKTPTALQSLVLAAILCAADTQQAGELLQKIGDRLLEDHLDAKSLSMLAYVLGVRPSSREEARNFLKQLAEKSPDDQCRVTATLALASSLAASQTEAEHRDEILQLLEKVQASETDYPLGPTSIKKLAEQLVTQVKYLLVGCVAQDITGVDVDGKSFTLADYRGSVVILDFFADWCPFCTRMYEQERMMMEKFRGRPFALLGVNTDPKKETLKKLIDEGKVTWPVWADGARGPIASGWQITAFPTIFVLDKEGVIRHIFRGDPGDKLEKAVEELM